jgi:Zn-dependent peptidase ImmA (M78 family)
MPGRQKIESLVSELLRSHKVVAPPIPVAQIARTQGLDVVIRTIDGDISGFIAKTGPSSGLIGVSSRDSRPRQRFTIAHELGHHFLSGREGLHVDQDVDPVLLFRDETAAKGVDTGEIQANSFAAELLMPSQMVLEDVEMLKNGVGDREIRDLADKYEVSPNAMTIKLQQLGVIAR